MDWEMSLHVKEGERDSRRKGREKVRERYEY